MADETIAWIQRIKAIEREYLVAVLASNRLRTDADRDPAVLGPDLRPRDVRDAFANLNATYAIRMFAEFETALRAYWDGTRTDAEPGRIAEIIDRIASREKVLGGYLSNAHRVRRYRNRQVHDNQEDGEHLDVGSCRSFLNSYLGRLPIDWVP